MSYHYHPAPDNPSITEIIHKTQEIRRRAGEIATRLNITEEQAALAQLTMKMARRVRLDRTPAASGLWSTLWNLGERLAAIDAPDRQPPLTLTPPKPFRDFSESVWSAEKQPIPSGWFDEEVK